MDCLTTLPNNDDINNINNSQLATDILLKLKYRNKLVRMADESTGDFNIVQEYELDSIASDSDD